MDTLRRLKQEYYNKLVIFKRLEEEALFILKSEIETKGIKIHFINSRIKTIESFIDKALRKQIENPFEHILDIVGVRIVCLFLSDIKKIAEIIRDTLLVLSEDNKVEEYEVSSFGYSSFHFIVKIKDEYSGPRYEKIKKFPFEIQVRTISMDAWANISHYLNYRSELDVPKELKRDFYALSGLFYVADTHFGMFYKARQEFLKKIEAFEYIDQLLSQEINRDTLSAYSKLRFSDREHMSGITLSDLIYELIKMGYKKIEDIENAFKIGYAAILEYEKDLMKAKKLKGRFSDVGIIGGLFCLIDENYFIRTENQTREAHSRRYGKYFIKMEEG